MTHAKRGLAAILAIGSAVALAGCSAFGTSTASTTSTSLATTTTTTTPPATSTTTATSPTSTTTTTTPAVPGETCRAYALQIATGRSSGAAGTIALGFVVTNIGSVSCTLDGYPALTLVPASGTLQPVITHTGSASKVSLGAGGGAGFVIEYGDEAADGQTSCPIISAVRVALPKVSGAPLTVATHFCPYGSPDVSISAVLSPSQYRALVG